MEVSLSSRMYKIILAVFFIISLSYFPAEGQGTSKHIPSLVRRELFPPDFLFGVGSSALQIEGRGHKSGRGPGVWDHIIERAHGGITDTDKFPIMIDHYNRYKEDVKILKELGINTYRFSISWSRVLSDGTLAGGINQKGLDFYNNLIDNLLANGITPFVTILHFDFPFAISRYGGFLNPLIVQLYKDYCDLLFKTYGDRVKHWSTVNEPEITAIFNYMHGYENVNAEPCQTTKECKEAYTLVHNFLLSHATGVQLYREKYQATQGGEIGIVFSVENYVPYSSNPKDVAAAERLANFYMGWILHPLVYGDYPAIMRELVGSRLPKFTEEETNMIKGSTDFIGINYYRSFYAKDQQNKTLINNLDIYDSLVTKELLNAQGQPLGHKDLATSNYVYPEGLYNVLVYLKKMYKNPKIYITENGITSGELVDPLRDNHRIDYIKRHLNYTMAAIEDGVNVRGYFVWAAFDTFEFYNGFKDRMGLIYVDFNDNLNRKLKDSARWYARFLKGRSRASGDGGDIELQSRH